MYNTQKIFVLVCLPLTALLFIPVILQDLFWQPQPFLSLPFNQGTKFKITEGRRYSEEEKAIHGYSLHYGIDYALERNSPILAPADGVAIASFHLAFASKLGGSAVWNADEARQYQGKFVGFGLGNFVQLWCQEQKVYVQLTHLERVAESIPFYKPTKRGNGWDPTVLYQSVEQIIKVGKPVKRGDVLGFAGDSGCSWGYLEEPGKSRPASKQYPSWDEVHVHLEVFQRGQGYGKKMRFDPYGLDDQAPAYQQPDSKKPGFLWLTDPDGNILHAK